MARGVVVVYFSRLGGRLRGDQKVMLDADAQLIAKLKGYDFRGHYEATWLGGCSASDRNLIDPVAPAIH